MPRALARTNERGLPVVSILVAAAVGTLALGPFKSWNALVAVVTGAVAIMYAFAPLSLAALHRVDADRPRSYRVPVPAILLPAPDLGLLLRDQVKPDGPEVALLEQEHRLRLPACP